MQASETLHRCFPMNFLKFLRTPFLQNSFGGCFWNWTLDLQGMNFFEFYFRTILKFWQIWFLVWYFYKLDAYSAVGRFFMVGKAGGGRGRGVGWVKMSANYCRPTTKNLKKQWLKRPKAVPSRNEIWTKL